MKSRDFCLFAALIVTGCSGGTHALPASSSGMTARPGAISPGFVRPAPMARTKILPSSVMRSVSPDQDFAGSGWTQVPGEATQAAAAPDGSLWVLAAQPSGADKYIWHYVNGTWTNIAGLASQLAPAPDGSLYVINSGGGTYHYAGGAWTALGGGAQAISVANDGSTYVISNAGAGSDHAIWKNSGGIWTLVGGAGNMLAANLDPGTYAVNGGVLGPYGLFVVNSAGSIYYTAGGGAYMQFPGAASAVAPSVGGVYVLGYPVNPSGNTIYYYDYKSAAWKAEPGSGVSMSANMQAVYVVSGSGAIYTTPLQQLSPALNPYTVEIDGVGSSAQATFTATAAGGGTVSIDSASTCLTNASTSGVATISPASAASGSTFTVTAVDAGSCTFLVHDAAGNTTTETVNIASTTITGQ